jgi:hypothetical protein
MEPRMANLIYLLHERRQEFIQGMAASFPKRDVGNYKICLIIHD